MRLGVCKQCGNDFKSLNSKDLCPDCVYKNNHNGKSRFEVSIEKLRLKKKTIKPRSKKSFERRKKVLEKDRMLYKYWFDTKPNVCEECGQPLPDKFENEEGDIIAIWQYSHILSKGSRPEFRHNILNGNRLCFDCHQKWEFGNKESMKIYPKNQFIIQKLINLKNE